MHFEIIDDITDIEPIAVGSTIREVARLRKQYGRGRWRQLKGIALIRLANGRTLLLDSRVLCSKHCSRSTTPF